MMRVLTCWYLGVAVAACNASSSPPSTTVTTPSGADWTRFGWDAGRSNVSTAPTGITASNIASLRRQQVPLDGTVDASPIYLTGITVNGKSHDVFFVTTTYGKTLAIDADDGSLLWAYTPPGYSSWVGSFQITTATPVADADRQFIYATSPDGRIQKLAVADGRVVWSTAITVLPQREKIAAALNYFNGRIFATTSGYVGDAPPYQGHVAILDAGTGQLEHVWNSLCSDRPQLLSPSSCPESDSGIWGRGGVVIDVATGNIFVATGNGRWDGRVFWGDATIELDADATHLLGSYTPANTDDLDARDLDLGSTSPVLLGGDLVLQGGKDGGIRLLSLQQMQGATSGRDGELQIVSTPSGDSLFTSPAVLHASDATWIFVADNGGTAGWTLRGRLLQQQWRTPFGGTSPVVAGGLLYVYDPRGGLRVYEPETGRVVATLDCSVGHWNSPIIVNGRIALPEGNANAHLTSGVLDIWRLSDSGMPARYRP